MSDWGNVGFYYDYERKDRWKKEKRIRGVIAKSYSWPGAVKMILHAYNGVKYFCNHRENEHTDFSLKAELFEGQNASHNINDLNTAFDVFFEYDHIDRGLDMVRPAYEERKSELFAGDDTYGYFLVSFTGNPGDGYELKYGYHYDGELRDLREALRIDGEKEGVDPKAKLPGKLEKAIRFFEKYGVQVSSEEEFWDILKNCENCVEDVINEENERKEKEAQFKAWRESATIEDIADEETIDALYLSVRTYNCLRRHGITTVGELKAMTKEELATVRNLGKKGLDEILSWFGESEGE